MMPEKKFSLYVTILLFFSVRLWRWFDIVFLLRDDRHGSGGGEGKRRGRGGSEEERGVSSFL